MGCSRLANHTVHFLAFSISIAVRLAFQHCIVWYLVGLTSTNHSLVSRPGLLYEPVKLADSYKAIEGKCKHHKRANREEFGKARAVLLVQWVLGLSDTFGEVGAGRKESNKQHSAEQGPVHPLARSRHPVPVYVKKARIRENI